MNLISCDNCDTAREKIAELEAQIARLREALEAGPSLLHTLPRGEICKCSQCEFVRVRRKVLVTYQTPPAGWDGEPLGENGEFLDPEHYGVIGIDYGSRR